MQFGPVECHHPTGHPGCADARGIEPWQGHPLFQIPGGPSSLFRVPGEGEVVQFDEGATVMFRIETPEQHAVGRGRVECDGQVRGHAMQESLGLHQGGRGFDTG